MNLLDDSVVPEYARPAKEEARAFAAEHVLPNAAAYFESATYPHDVIEAGRDAGLVAQDIDEAYGGRGFDVVEVLAIAEELFRADAGIALSLQLASFGAEILETYGTEAQKETWLRPVAEGEMLTGLAVSEPETGSDLAGMDTRADREGDEYVLNGEKYWIGNGVEADWITVYARTDDDPDNKYGNHSLFIVPTDTEGYEAEHIPEKIAMRASKQAHITFDDCRIPADNLIGSEGAGFMLLAEFFNHGRTVVAGHGLGLAAAAIEETLEFVGEREAFDRTLDRFQAVQHGVADMLIEFESARSLAYRAASKVRDGERAGYWAALAKTKCTETAVDCAEQGMQFHGGRSVLEGRRIGRVYRDARIPVIYEGASEVQRNLIYSQR
ncbi:MAG: acyl-CoA dehydrogenase family protein [Halobacteriaceae archaeon]